MVKSFCIIFSFLISFSATTASSRSAIGEAQAKSYIEHVLTTLSAPSNHNGEYVTDLTQFIDQTVRMLMKRQGKYSSWWSGNKLYTTDELFEGAVGALLTYIEDSTRIYAEQEIGALLQEKNKQHQVVNTVVKNMSNELLALITVKHNTLYYGLLTGYIGARLKSRVIDALKDEIKRILIEYKPGAYTSSECVSCLDSYDDTDIIRINLYCGHDICHKCIVTWHKKFLEDSFPCPTCKKILNIKDYIR